jgi:hypothetical protein
MTESGATAGIERARRTLAIRLVTAMSGAGLLLVAVAWVLSH